MSINAVDLVKYNITNIYLSQKGYRIIFDKPYTTTIAGDALKGIYRAMLNLLILRAKKGSQSITLANNIEKVKKIIKKREYEKGEEQREEELWALINEVAKCYP